MVDPLSQSGASGLSRSAMNQGTQGVSPMEQFQREMGTSQQEFGFNQQALAQFAEKKEVAPDSGVLKSALDAVKDMEAQQAEMKEKVSGMSPSDANNKTYMMQMQMDMANLSFQETLITKVADKISSGAQKLMSGQ